MAYQYFTDSCCDLTREYVQERNFQVIPMLYRIGEQDYLDDYGSSMSYHAFYDRLRAGQSSTTTQIPIQRFIDLFMPVLSAGDDVLYLAFSSALSGTYLNAVAASEQLMASFPGRKVLVVDSKSASMGQGLLMHHVLNRRDEGMDGPEVAQWIEGNRLKLCHWFTVDDLNHLKRGGRVSAASAFFGTMLSIKPVLHVDDAGRLIPMEKAKGRARSIKGLLEHMHSTAIAPEGQTVFISHGDSPNEAQQLAQMVRDQMGVKDIRIHYIGPIIGTHSGPGTIALFFLGAKR